MSFHGRLGHGFCRWAKTLITCILLCETIFWATHCTEKKKKKYLNVQINLSRLFSHNVWLSLFRSVRTTAKWQKHPRLITYLRLDPRKFAKHLKFWEAKKIWNRMDCDESPQHSKKRFTQNSGSHSPKRAMAELRHSSSIGARSSSSPMKRDEGSSPLISDTQSDDDARGRHVYKDRGDRSFCSYFYSLCPFLNEDARVSTQGSRISLFLLVFVVLVASISIFSVVRHLVSSFSWFTFVCVSVHYLSLEIG